MNPFSKLVQSRKFWLAVADAFFSTITILLTLWLNPEQLHAAQQLVGIWQPVIIAVIVGITIEDAAAKLRGG